MIFEQIYPKLQSEQQKAQYELAAYWNGGADVLVDEMSILYANEDQLKNQLELFQQEGWTEDRVVTDILTVVSHPTPWTGKGFGVEFHFWTHPAFDWRIEAMLHTAGIASPLHDHALAIARQQPSIIHASFKLPSAGAYTTFVQGQPDDPALSYRNDYGQFCYFGRGPVYIKPRVNLRDVAGAPRLA
jgi:hypothetical protein